MSSTNVHSNMHIVGGSTSFSEDEKEPVNMQKYNQKGEPLAGKGPSVIEVVQGEKAVISVQSNVVVKDNNKVVGRATTDGKVLSGDAEKVRRALNADKERD